LLYCRRKQSVHAGLKIAGAAGEIARQGKHRRGVGLGAPDRVLYGSERLGYSIGVGGSTIDARRDFVGRGRALINGAGDLSSHAGHGRDGLSGAFHALHGVPRGFLNRGNLTTDLVSRLRDLGRERFDLGRHHRKAAAGLARTGSLSPYQMSSSNFDVAFITPVLTYGAQYQSEQARGRERRRGVRTLDPEPAFVRLLMDFSNWSDYVADVPPVLLVRVTPKLVEGFWTTVARGAARTQGVSLPPIKHFKSGFSQMRASD